MAEVISITDLIKLSKKQNNDDYLELDIVGERYRNASCGDFVTLSINSNNTYIYGISSVQDACVVGRASLGHMQETLSHRPISEIAAMTVDDYLATLPFAVIQARRNCALLPYHALIQLLKDHNKL